MILIQQNPIKRAKIKDFVVVAASLNSLKMICKMRNCTGEQDFPLPLPTRPGNRLAVIRNGRPICKCSVQRKATQLLSYVDDLYNIVFEKSKIR